MAATERMLRAGERRRREAWRIVCANPDIIPSRLCVASGVGSRTSMATLATYGWRGPDVPEEEAIEIIHAMAQGRAHMDVYAAHAAQRKAANVANLRKQSSNRAGMAWRMRWPKAVEIARRKAVSGWQVPASGAWCRNGDTVVR